MLSTPEAFVAAGKLATKVVHVPEWNDDVTIREVSAQTLIDDMRKADERTGMAKMIIKSVIKSEDDQTLVFQETKEHIALILGMGMKGVVSLAKEITAFNGIGEDAKKNSENDLSKTASTSSATA